MKFTPLAGLRGNADIPAIIDFDPLESWIYVEAPLTATLI